jgi:hypothetical protein
MLGVKIYFMQPMFKISLLSLYLTCLLCLGCTQSTGPQKDDISITAKICGKANRVSEMDSTSGDYLFINLTLTNQTNSSKSIWLYSCSWMRSWKIEPDTLFFYSEGCDANYPKRIDLKPDQSVTFNGIIANCKNISDTIHLRVGFADFNEIELQSLIQYSSRQLIKKLNPKVYWSNWLSVKYFNNSYEIIK